MPAKLTKALLETLKVGERVRDTKVRGFFAERTARGISLKVQADIWRAGKLEKTCRVTLGRFGTGPGEFDLDAARTKAQTVLGKIKGGIDPNAPEQPAAGSALTCGVAFDRYAKHLRTRQRPAAPRTVAEFERLTSKCLGPLAPKSLSEIKPSELEAERQRIARDHGPVTANKALRAFRSAYNLARDRADDPGVFQERITRGVEWSEEKPRKIDLGPAELPKWYAAVCDLSNPLRRVMHEMALFSGLRPGNLTTIRRDWIDLEKRTITIPRSEMKSRKRDGDFILPLSERLIALVKDALRIGTDIKADTPWLFPARAGHIVVVREKTLGIGWGHALRHCYATQATAAGVDPTSIEILLDHAVGGGGIAAWYQQAGGLRGHLLASQEKISAHLLSLIKKPTAASGA